MLSKTVTYVDYNGNERTETFNFNLTKAEMTEMELGVTGGLTTMLDNIVKAKDTPALVREFKKLVLYIFPYTQ